MGVLCRNNYQNPVKHTVYEQEDKNCFMVFYINFKKILVMNVEQELYYNDTQVLSEGVGCLCLQAEQWE